MGRISKRYTPETKISEVTGDPAFGSYGRLIFPVGGYYHGNTLGELYLPWYSCVDANKTVEITNYMRAHAQGEVPIFFDIYTPEEKAEDPAKGDTGLFYFRGAAGKPFAICSAGGAFVYVAAMHDSFPHALELSKRGYHAFVLIYRPNARYACEDLARAVRFVFAHAEELGVDTSCYSLWGGSAGARMAAWLGTYGPAVFGGGVLPAPGAVVMQYTGHREYSRRDPPTYGCIGDCDSISSWRTMQRRLRAMSDIGIDTEFHVFHGLGHGFGLGAGTEAEGWLDGAVSFWQRRGRR